MKRFIFAVILMLVLWFCVSAGLTCLVINAFLDEASLLTEILFAVGFTGIGIGLGTCLAVVMTLLFIMSFE